MAEETKAQANKKLAEKVANVNQLAREQSQKNVITTRFSKTEVVKTDEGTDHEQTYLLHFPGTFAAQNLIDSAMNPFNNINKTYFMQEAVKQIVEAPKIKDLAYFNDHHGFSELFEKIYSFLDKGLN
ncbi:hypothetical protein OQI89_10555 [Lentilactobacillus diolivorans]|uniref:hypothetical protein n=1 Tax=Lentilactobacillus diolivorans TaxID=179838 RepID=UPI0021E7097F|nr:MULTISPECIES: hypothetical protein [Lentilactobacillus]MCV3742957.1 hypothetical protein [Lentilactobacillus hilgardii]MDH5106291.1 hypothetical protein [Lentilactobacillus diolivorans]